MRIINDAQTAVSMYYRTLDIDGGPTLPAGPLYHDDVEFITDTVVFKWEEGTSINWATASGYRYRDGQLNKSYRHQRLYTHREFFPDWLKELL